jgi:hypothetical protein
MTEKALLHRMREVYRGYELTVERAESLGGWPITDITAYRLSDRWEAVCEQTEGEDPVSVLMDCLKRRVDEAIQRRALMDAFDALDDACTAIASFAREDKAMEELYGKIDDARGRIELLLDGEGERCPEK